MAIGQGKYDPECSELLEKLGASMVMLIVVGGTRGQGFSVSATDVALLEQIPEVLRNVAAQIEADIGLLKRTIV